MDPNQTSSPLATASAQPTTNTSASVVTPSQPNSVPSPKPPELPKTPEKLLSAPAHHTSWGALVGIVLILIVLIIGGLYFWGAELAKEDSAQLAPFDVTDTSDATGFVPDIESAQ